VEVVEVLPPISTRFLNGSASLFVKEVLKTDWKRFQFEWQQAEGEG